MHPEVNTISTGKRMWRFSNISNLSTSGSELNPDLDKRTCWGRSHSDNSISVFSPPNIDLTILRAIVSKDHVCSDSKSDREGSDTESRGFTSDPEPNRDSRGSNSNPEPDGKGQLSDKVDLKLRTGIAIKKYSFLEQNLNFNLYAPFGIQNDYQLKRYFSSAKISSTKITEFFKDKILKDINSMYTVQFRSAHTLHVLTHTTANEPYWYSG